MLVLLVCWGRGLVLLMLLLNRGCRRWHLLMLESAIKLLRHHVDKSSLSIVLAVLTQLLLLLLVSLTLFGSVLRPWRGCWRCLNSCWCRDGWCCSCCDGKW